MHGVKPLKCPKLPSDDLIFCDCVQKIVHSPVLGSNVDYENTTKIFVIFCRRYFL